MALLRRGLGLHLKSTLFSRYQETEPKTIRRGPPPWKIRAEQAKALGTGGRARVPTGPCGSGTGRSDCGGCAFEQPPFPLSHSRGRGG